MNAARLLKSPALTAAVVLLSVGAAVAAPAKQPKGDTQATKSAIIGTTFPDRPYVLQDDGSYAEFMTAVAKDLGRACKTLESFGWDLKVGDQARLTQIVDVTMDAVQKDGFKATQVQPKVTEGTQAVAISAEKAKKQVLILWAPVGKGVVLLICDAAPAATAK